MSRRLFNNMTKKTIQLLHFESNMNDESGNTKNASLYSSNNFSYVTGKFGQCLYLQNSSAPCKNYINTGIVLGGGDFTVELWISVKSYVTMNKNAIILDFGGSNTQAGVLALNSSGTYVCFYAQGNKLNAATTINGWTHVAIVRKQGVIYVFINGVLLGSFSSTYNFTENLYIGYNRDSGMSNSYSEFLYGYIDELRISNIARWTSSFTVPSAPYTAD